LWDYCFFNTPKGGDDANLTAKFWFDGKTLIRFMIWTFQFMVKSLYRMPWCQTLSNVFSKSRKMADVLSILLKLIARSSTSLVSWIVVESSGRKAYCSGRIKGEAYDLRSLILESRTVSPLCRVTRWVDGSLDLFFISPVSESWPRFHVSIH